MTRELRQLNKAELITLMLTVDQSVPLIDIANSRTTEAGEKALEPFTVKLSEREVRILLDLLKDTPEYTYRNPFSDDLNSTTRDDREKLSTKLLSA